MILSALSFAVRLIVKPVTVTLVSYAVTQSAYEKIIPKFVEEWQQKTGQKVTFEQSYGGSGSQTRAVIDGLEADVVALALALDTKKIEQAGLIQPGWEKEAPNDSIVHKSVVAFVPRDANIKINKWSDLAKDNIKVITANPKTSGGARWNFLALWGSVTQAGGSEQEAQTFVEKVFKNAPVLPRDARESSDVFFKQGQGNVLINYENEMILANQKGENLAYTVPTDYNISIAEALPIGAEFDFLITRGQDAEGQVTLSLRQLLLQKAWENVREISESGKSVQLRVTGVNKGGVTGEVEGLKGFIPRSHLIEKNDLDSLIGQLLTATFIQIDQENNKLVLSQREIARANAISQLAVGKLLSGTVVKLQPYGVFVDCGGVTGLLHAKQVTGASFNSAPVFSIARVRSNLAVSFSVVRGVAVNPVSSKGLIISKVAK